MITTAMANCETRLQAGQMSILVTMLPQARAYMFDCCWLAHSCLCKDSSCPSVGTHFSDEFLGTGGEQNGQKEAQGCHSSVKGRRIQTVVGGGGQKFCCMVVG